MAWCAGFFDGEGVALYLGGKPVLQVSFSSPEPLHRLRNSLNGRVYGPYYSVVRRGNHDEIERIWYWQCRGETAQAAALVLAPLCTHQRERLQKLL
jgi:hypothetical protein